MITWGSYHSGNILLSREAGVGVGWPKVYARQGFGWVRIQGEACQDNRQSSDLLSINWISQFHPEKWKCQHVHTRSHCDPFSAQQIFLLWSIKSALCGDTPTDRISTLGGTLQDPTVQTASPLGAHNGSSQERALTNPLGEKTNLFNIDIAFL